MQPHQPQQPSFGNAFPPSQGAPPAGPPKKKTNWALIGGIGCLSLVVVCCVVPVGGFFAGNASAKSRAEDAVADIAAAGRANDADRVYGMLDSWAQSSADRTRFPEAMSRCTGLTTNTSVTVDDVRIDHPFDDFILVEVTYQTPSGPIGGSFGLENESDGYKIGTYSEDDPTHGYGHCTLRTPYDYGY